MLPSPEKILLLNTLPGMAYRSTVYAPWTLQFVSPGARFVTSIDRHDLVSGKIGWASIIHPEDLPLLEEEVARGISRKSPFTLAYRILDPEWGEKWVLERGEAVYGEDGRPEALIGFIEDITELKQVERKLRESEDHYRAAVELNPQIPWTADPSGHILEVGPKWLEMLGEKESRLLGQGWIDALHPDDRERVLESWQHSLVTGDPLDNRYRLRLSDGSYRWVRARAAARRQKNGDIFRWYGTLEDIHEQVELENELRLAEERYALAARATGDVIWDWNVDDGSVHRIASPGSMFGYSREEFETSSSEWWQSLVHPEDRERVAAGIRQIVSGIGDRWSDQYRLRRADGDYAHILDRGYMVRTDEGFSRRMVGAMQDISEQHAAEERLRQLQADLVHMAHQSALGTMAATVAHELNQPLAAAANYLAGSRRMLLGLEGKTKSQIEAGLDETENQIRRAGEIIRRMRDVVAKGSGTREPASLKRLIAEVANLMEASRSCPGLIIRSRVEDEADAVAVDSIQIEQVLLNLVRNASESMRGMENPTVVISGSRRDERFVEVRVRDFGRGLSQAIMDKIFTAFTESTTGGLGVGLSVSRTIIDAHGGWIRAENNSDAGASFYFTVPAVGAEAANREIVKEA